MQNTNPPILAHLIVVKVSFPQSSKNPNPHLEAMDYTTYWQYIPFIFLAEPGELYATNSHKLVFGTSIQTIDFQQPIWDPSSNSPALIIALIATVWLQASKRCLEGAKFLRLKHPIFKPGNTPNSLNTSDNYCI